MKYARIDNNTIIEFRVLNPEDIPPHKSSWWLPVEDIKPAVNEFYYLISSPVPKILEDKVVMEYSVTARNISQLQSLVKQEAERRIIEMYPLWKQSNMLADKIALLNKTRTAEEDAQLADIEQAFAFINNVRQRSNIIENMDPIPQDYASDTYW